MALLENDKALRMFNALFSDDEIEGYSSIVEMEGEVYHVAGVSEGEEAYIDYQIPADDVLQVKRDDINVMYGDIDGY